MNDKLSRLRVGDSSFLDKPLRKQTLDFTAHPFAGLYHQIS
ncbi:hypothetical protein RB623_21435 [Mesorhizobium sp. LHD-90]|nr:hypothetical protein [Mesorhizobium sp. LHD-90]MDQ6436621.1 hypothetical protein [Mesorhizobium sp. LHD-90]